MPQAFALSPSRPEWLPQYESAWRRFAGNAVRVKLSYRSVNPCVCRIGRTTIRAMGRAHMTPKAPQPTVMQFQSPAAKSPAASRSQSFSHVFTGATVKRSNGMSMRSMEAFYQSLDVPASRGL